MVHGTLHGIGLIILKSGRSRNWWKSNGIITNLLYLKVLIKAYNAVQLNTALLYKLCNAFPALHIQLRVRDHPIQHILFRQNLYVQYFPALYHHLFHGIKNGALARVPKRIRVESAFGSHPATIIFLPISASPAVKFCVVVDFPIPPFL